MNSVWPWEKAVNRADDSSGFLGDNLEKARVCPMPAGSLEVLSSFYDPAPTRILRDIRSVLIIDGENPTFNS